MAQNDLLTSLLKEAEGKTEDLTVTIDGAPREILKAGTTVATLVKYVEVGQHKSTFKGEEKINDEVQLVFEIKENKTKYPRTETEDGRVFAPTITVFFTKSRNSKSTSHKLFTAMNWDRKHTSFVTMLGKHFMLEIENKLDDQGKPVSAFVNKNSIRKPSTLNPETGDEVMIKAPDFITPPALFLWDHPTKAQWDSLKKPNGEESYLNERIREAINFDGSPVQFLVGTGNAEVTVGATTDVDSILEDDSEYDFE